MPLLSLEELSPSYVRERRIDLSLAVDSESPLALRSVLIEVSYSRTMPEGVVLPLVFEVHGPSADSYLRREYLRSAPRNIIFTPREGGRHMVSLREIAHNKWWGSLIFDVAGERILRRDE